MTTELEEMRATTQDVDAVIASAIKKIGGRSENDLCRYLSLGEGEHYMHHFTLRKMRHKDPQGLIDLIEKTVLKAANPQKLPSKRRAARGSRKRKDVITFTRPVLERLLNLAKTAGDKEITYILRPPRSLAAVKRELLQSIRQNRTEQELWNMYSDLVAQQSQNQTNPFQE